MSRGVACALALGIALGPRPSRGDERRPVAVAAPAIPDPVLGEAALRIRAELDAAGVGSYRLACGDDRDGTGDRCASDPSMDLVRLSRAGEAVAIEAITRPPGQPPRRRVVEVGPGDGAADPAVLAVRAVELLRDLTAEVPPEPAPAPPEAVAPPVPAPPPSPARLQVVAGGATMSGTHGLGTALGLAAAASFRIAGPIAVVAAAAGPFIETPPASEIGQAKVWQVLLTLGVRAQIDERRTHVFAAAAAGELYLRARGDVRPDAGGTLDGVTSIVWTPVVGGGLGASFDLSSRWALVGEADAMWALPAVDVTMGSDVIGRAGAPSVLLQLGLAFAIL